MVDRRYGVNKYGDGKLYGPSDPRQALAWDVSVDWDGDSIFDANEANRVVGIAIDRGRKRLLQPVGQGFEKVATGKATLTLLNRDGRFDGWNTSSPLYPNVDGGKDIKIRVRDMNTGTIYPLFRGVITNLVPTGSGQDEKVVISASDGLDYLRNINARVAGMQQGITPDVAIGKVLDAALWPWERALDVSADTIPYWFTSDKKAMSEIEDLALSFLGYFFADAQGRARFIKRSSAASAVANYQQEQLLKEIGNPQPYDIRRNVTRIKVHPRKQAASGILWQLVGTPPFIDPGSANAQILFATYTYNNTPTPALSPTVGTKSMNTASDGSGTDQTANCTVDLTDFGSNAKLVITNNSGSRVFLRQLEINGVAVYEPNVSDITYPKDLSTVKRMRELLFDLLWQQDLNVGRDNADVLGPFYAGLNPIPNVQIDNRPELQFAVDLFDIVTASLPKIGIDGNSFRVGGIEHKSDPKFENCQRVISRIYLEPYISAANFMQWDTNAVWDLSTVPGY